MVSTIEECNVISSRGRMIEWNTDLNIMELVDILNYSGIWKMNDRVRSKILCEEMGVMCI
jgi:hypothetical protein